jgi:DNA-3-methyladenine glycosylase II
MREAKMETRRTEPLAVIGCDADIASALHDLMVLDPRLAPVAAAAGPVPLRREPPAFSGLAGIIVAQMISKASAAAIWARMEAHHGRVDAAACLAMTDETGRAIGLSRAKTAALRTAAEAVAAGTLDLQALCTLEAGEAVGALTALPGIGRWTAEVYLLVCAGHPDVFPSGDVALQAAVAHALGLPARPSAPALDRLAAAWSPWRSVAARLFWAYYGANMRRDAAPAPLRPFPPVTT